MSHLSVASGALRSKREVDANWRLLALLGALSTFGPFSLDMYLPGLPSLGQDLSAPPWAVHATVSGFVIGMALGQLVGGPVSDRFGRRRPLLIGLVAYASFSALCAVSADIWILVALRVAQGAAGATGVVIARAMVRDITSGVEAARAYGLLMLVSGVAPILAPVVGGRVLQFGTWRSVFVVLAVIGLLLLVLAAVRLPETLPTALRRRGGFAASRRAMAAILRDRRFVRHAAVGAFGFSALLMYISGSPFLLQSVHGLSPQEFSLSFCGNAVGVLVARQAAVFLLPRLGTTAVLRLSLTLMAAGAAGLVAAAALSLGVALVLGALFATMASYGGVAPAVIALALEDHPESAGSAAGLLGFTQFMIGSALAPAVGALGVHAGLPMALAMLTLAVGAMLVLPGARPTGAGETAAAR